MGRALILIAAAALAAPALAQHGGHHMPGHTMPKAKPVPEAKPRPAAKPKAKAAPAKKASPARKTAAKPRPKPAAREAAPKPRPKAAPSKPAGNPHAGHTMPAAPAPAADPHAGHQMGTAEPAAPPNAPPPAEALSGPAHAADLVYDPAAMAEAREGLRREHGDIQTSKVLIDQLEAKLRDGRDAYAWDGQAWYGGDINKLWLKSEGEGEFGGRIDDAEVQALWSRAIDPWFDLQLGVRQDFRRGDDRTHLAAGVQGLAPYWFEVDAALFLSDKGDVTGRIEAEYDLRLTQRLILQPRLEVELALQDVPELDIGSGLSSGELGARLRYEIVPEFAPYLGVEYERAFGDTADFHRAGGEDAGSWSFLVGVRTWF